MAKILDGKKTSEKILENLKKEIKKKQLKLKLAVVLVSRDPVSEIFIRQLRKSCEKIGIDFELFKLFSKKEIQKVIKNPHNSGIIIAGSQEFSGLIPPEKNVEKISPVVCAVERILKEYRISLAGKNVALVGRGRLVGRPLAKWLRKQKINFSNIDKSFTFVMSPQKVKDKIKKADIIISGVGKPNLITGEMVKGGVVVIDFGKDVDFNSVYKKSSFITPTPGGVGPVVVACLLENLVKMEENCSLPRLWQRTVL